MLLKNTAIIKNITFLLKKPTYNTILHRTIFCASTKLYYTRTIMISNLTKIIIQKRTMLSKAQIKKKTLQNSIGTSLTCTKRYYAVSSGNKPEMPSAKSDPQGLINNPEIGPNKVRHVEKHVQTCVEDPECKIKSCTTVCGTPGDRFASLLLTHGKNNPATPQGPMKTLSNKDYKGNNYVQKAVFYNKATKTAATTEDTQATAYLNRPDIKAKTEPYENIP